jgi:allophanate hydrolase subunit 2
LQAGDCLELSLARDSTPLGKRRLPVDMISQYKSDIHVRVILGPEQAHFSDAGITAFLRNAYEVSNQSDRMGLRLKGDVLEHKNGPDILSSGISFGAIQVAGDGQPIVLMADRQTTGGYTRIASVISVDLPLMAQAKPGDKVRFHPVDVSEAQLLFREREKKIDALQKSFEQAAVVMNQGTREFRVRVNGREYEVSVMEIK